ncbi:MAG: NADH-quinone oxidoreductase subunit NuoF [Proteiniphilum sp.]|jgi:NADH:ubiquinone oxidoreductase subunit F (NADH-binding)/(2Fe-2S) ferredoxin/ferredoxin|nr:NADH-quinone oxidoreductase subunit NuoF [Proteiniphilum sp.]MDD3779115.1 NADH-quinone oxidoreductase subunit NuoF [Proteiniphilum sp.]MDD4452298.1 NADH-quinone oxidoreductase subunit NuoF [Proteiniphilum sp.]
MSKYNTHLLVCAGTGCHSSESNLVYEMLRDEVMRKGLDKTVQIIRTGCFGFCEKGPILKILPDNTFYTQVKPTDAREIIDEHVIKGRKVTRLLYADPETNSPILNSTQMSFYKKQLRVALRNCGAIDPENIDESIARDAYQALGKVLLEYTPQETIDVIKQSGLRGRGGAGFSTGLKWELTARNESTQKYVVCNADEGDPGAFMDRSILEGDPHVILEAMAICGFCIGANKGLIYIRAEYPMAIKRLKIAISQAKEYGLMGERIFDSDFSFDITLKYGAGAFVCGEETALIHSMEGKRGEPSNKPPYPAQSGYLGKPTCVNNVETFANVPVIILKGADWFSSIGTAKSKGTKVFALAGKINNVGLIEVPMGTTLREIIYEIGGGIKNGKKFKAVQTGGPSGGCLTEKHLDTPIDYESLAAAGSMMGSGGMIVLDEDDCMVSVAKFYLDFIVEESCGKCVPCRIGNKRLYETLDRITVGKGKPEDIEKLKNLCSVIKDTSLCGLGQTSPNPVLSTLNNFMEEYHEHVYEKKCRSGKCRSLLYYVISEEECIGCMACKRVCPTHAISGEKKEVHQINQEICIKCGACMEKCQFDAIHLQNDYPKVTAII